MGNRIFTGFLVLIFSTLLWFIPITDLIYTFKTDIKTDSFYSPTAVASTNVTVTLTKFIFNSDTSTIDVLSTLNTDAPAFASYNGTTRATVFTGLTDNTTRTLEVSYDVDALNSATWTTVLDLFPRIWMLIIICFPIVGLIFILRA